MMRRPESPDIRRSSSLSIAQLPKNRERYTIVACLLTAGIILCILFVSVPPANAGNNGEANVDIPGPSGMLFVGEELEYEVSYSIFSLGKVKIQVVDTALRNGTTVYRAKAFMDSYSGVPFVSLHWIFYSEIDPLLFSHYFSGIDNKDTTSVPYSNYTFDYGHDRVYVERGVRPQGDSITRSSDTISTTYQDGLSLFFYARGRVHSTGGENVPTFVDEKKVNTFINFMNKTTSTEIDAIKYPVETIEFDGRADFVGIFGLTGGFSGWFSNDEAAIPIVAKMKVIIGSIRLELVKWNRPGWVPPRAAEN